MSKLSESIEREAVLEIAERTVVIEVLLNSDTNLEFVLSFMVSVDLPIVATFHHWCVTNDRSEHVRRFLEEAIKSVIIYLNTSA